MRGYWAWCALAAIGSLAALPSRGSACGGTFCDSRPPVPMQPPPTVEQSGENILFVQLDGEIEVHVQIRYQGDPARLAWLVPMPQVPEVSIGSQPLFDALLSGSAPVFGVRTTRMRCDGTTETRESQGCGGGAPADAPTTGGVAGRSDDSSAMMDPIGKTVGSFELTILQPESSDEVMQWIMDNDFQLPEGAQGFLEPYVQARSVFVAIRLAPGRGVSEIHPIVFRYPGTRPSIPLQLTAVAATVDMRIRTFFLGDERAVPSNYRHVELNSLRLDWPAFAGNYESVVSGAVDETGDGLGFVTEYAGASSVIDRESVYDARWDADAFRGMDPIAAVDELVRQGQMTCRNGVCAFPHPLLLALLQQYIPAPAGSDENAFYGCLRCAKDRIDASAWDADAFAREYAERVIAPAQRARELLAGQPYLTRMLTFMSPEEMTADPAFHLRGGLPNVERERWAEQIIPCSGPSTFELPDGRQVVLGLDTLFAWPGRDSSVPSAERIEQLPESGEPVVLLDASAEIDLAIAKINERNRTGGVDLEDVRSGGACRIAAPLAQQNAWIAAALSYLAWRRRRASPLR